MNGKIPTSRNQLNINPTVQDPSRVLSRQLAQASSTQHVNVIAIGVIMLRHARKPFHAHHPDPFELMSEPEKVAYQNKIEAFEDAVRSAKEKASKRRGSKRKSLERPPAAGSFLNDRCAIKEKKRPAADVPMRGDEGEADPVAQLLARLDREVFSLEPDPFHRVVTSSLRDALRANQIDVPTVLALLDRSQRSDVRVPHHYFCVSLCRKLGVKRNAHDGGRQ